ncbi:MAG: SDR family NAD(P)-dependent oxidoreductase [Anaerolineales bacterium]|nr:SDR family NAD(P)-dependent oxidoreductase [Anaerolineales bacterium]
MPSTLLWGAAGGIGKALTQQLTASGHMVVAVSRHPAEMKALTPRVIAADVTQPAQVSAAARMAAGMGAPFDLFIYAAGDIASLKTAEMTPADWNRILSANLTGAFLTAQASLPHLKADARLVFIGAVHERLRLPGLSAYAAAKAGLEAFAEVLRKETRLPVLVVRPGAVDTPFWKKVPFSMPKNALSPQTLAEKILTALEEDKTGMLDIG